MSGGVAEPTRSLKRREPILKGKPGYSSKSFNRKGTPLKGPSGSAPLAFSRARSKSSATNALICGLTLVIRSMAASTSSIGVTSPLATSSACPVASSWIKSDWLPDGVSLPHAAKAVAAAPPNNTSRRDNGVVCIVKLVFLPNMLTLCWYAVHLVRRHLADCGQPRI